MKDVSQGLAKVLLKTDRFVDGLHTCVGECTHTQRACSSLKRQVWVCIAVFAGMDVCFVAIRVGSRLWLTLEAAMVSTRPRTSSLS